MSLGVVIIAGGEGQRLRSVTGALPKALAPLAGATLLDHQLARCAPLGATETVVLTCAGRGHGAIVEHVGDRAQVRCEPRPLGTAGGLRLLPAGPTRWLVVNIDHISDVDRGALVEAARAPVTAVLWRAPVPIDEGVVELGPGPDGGQRLVGWQERPVLRLPVTTGLYVFSAAALEAARGPAPLDMPELVMAHAPAGVHVHMHTGFWIDAGTPRRLAQADAWLSAQAAPG